MSNKKIWSGVLPLTILAAMIGGLILLGQVSGQIDEGIIENGIETNGIAFDEGSRMVNIRYNVNGTEYTRGIGKGFSNIEDGEEFLIKYLPEDPTSIVVFFNKPILSDKYAYSKTECIYLDKTFSVVDFQYKVNGEIIKREALYEDNQSLNPADYIVQYRTERPTIGYLIQNSKD